MRVAYCTPEVFPFSKTGGLADVADSLPGALAARGLEMTVFSPWYRSVGRWCASSGLTTRHTVIPSGWASGHECEALHFRVADWAARRFVFVVNDTFYDRAQLYVDDDGKDHRDNLERFAHFCRATLEYCLFTGLRPDVFHVNDWQTALLPVYLKTTYRDSALGRVPSVLTLHNLGYQGLFPAETIHATGLDSDVFTPEGLEFYGRLNLLKGGIVFADALTTVSPTYAEEIGTEAHGKGLHGVIEQYRQKLTGILNGISKVDWDPSTDPHLPAPYGPEDLSAKALCKRALQREVGLPSAPRPLLLGVVTRLDAQKGVHLIVEAFPTLADIDLQLVILGTGDCDIEDRIRRLVEAHPARLACRIGFDEALAHLIEAGADSFLMPSAYEPCGLNQMYSHRYGTIPIVRATGGLADTVIDATPDRLAAGDASGFSFEEFAADRLAGAIRRAADLYFRAPAAWSKLVQYVMRLDHSWARSAEAYRRIYSWLVGGSGSP